MQRRSCMMPPTQHCHAFGHTYATDGLLHAQADFEMMSHAMWGKGRTCMASNLFCTTNNCPKAASFSLMASFNPTSAACSASILGSTSFATLWYVHIASAQLHRPATLPLACTPNIAWCQSEEPPTRAMKYASPLRLCVLQQHV